MTKPTKWVCAQSDQSRRRPHEETLGTWLPIERTAKTLIRLGGCPSWSESSLGAHSFCWFCRVAGHVSKVWTTQAPLHLLINKLMQSMHLSMLVFPPPTKGILGENHVYEPAHEIIVLITKATSEGSGKPVHPHSLARAFAVRMHEVWKQTKGQTKHQISSRTGWLRMRVWRMSLRRSSLIAAGGSGHRLNKAPA